MLAFLSRARDGVWDGKSKLETNAKNQEGSGKVEVS